METVLLDTDDEDDHATDVDLTDYH